MAHDIKIPIPTEVIETSVAGVEQYRGGTLVRTYQSNFRPRFGGQLEDRGEIYIDKWYDISDVIFLNNHNYFFVRELKDSKCKVGTPVLIRLDIYRRMQVSMMHTAIHLICALTDNEMVLGYAGFPKSRVDFYGSAEDFNNGFSNLVTRFRDCVEAKLDVSAIYVEREGVARLGKVKEFRSEVDDEILRIIKISGVDLRVCNGTHIQNTEMLSDVYFGSAKNTGKDKFKVNLHFKNVLQGKMC